MVKANTVDNFLEKVNMWGECWEWEGYKNPKGYGVVSIEGHRWRVHRVSYVLVHLVIPEGTELDHLCRNRACINPDHLEAVTPKENVRRGSRSRQTHCKEGHAFSKANTIINRLGNRACRICKNSWYRQDRANKKKNTAGPHE